MKISNFLKTNKIKRLKGTDNPLVRDYVLPDYANVRFGYAKTHEESNGKPKESEQVTFSHHSHLLWSNLNDLIYIENKI